MAISIKSDIGYTSESVKFYERYKEAFGEVIMVEMKDNPYELTLTNKLGETLVFERGLTSGYLGEGCRGTQKVLRLAGFVVKDEFINSNANFKLKK